MNTRTRHPGSRTMRVVKGLMLQVATAALVAACAGGGYGDDDGNAPPPAPLPPPAAVIRDAQFIDDTVSGLRFNVTGVGEGVTDAVGKFQFAEGRRIDFLVGGTANRIAIGSAAPSYNAPIVSFSLQHLEEVRSPNGDTYLANLLRLLVLLDANNDSSDGFQIDATANTAISAAVGGTRTLDFAASAASFGNDATIVAVATALNRTLVSADEALVRYQLLFRQSRFSSNR